MGNKPSRPEVEPDLAEINRAKDDDDATGGKKKRNRLACFKSPSTESARAMAEESRINTKAPAKVTFQGQVRVLGASQCRRMWKGEGNHLVPEA